MLRVLAGITIFPQSTRSGSAFAIAAAGLAISLVSAVAQYMLGGHSFSIALNLLTIPAGICAFYGLIAGLIFLASGRMRRRGRIIVGVSFVALAFSCFWVGGAIFVLKEASAAVSILGAFCLMSWSIFAVCGVCLLVGPGRES
jgi:hypothetical protein